ncbi:MFS transporter, DHA1 family, bicyclomycin/chloramphenicol resistance protein [Cyclobacterium lianum]|uniref:MFS transporter, DHA1 family, bicyclomycin/chloramphenicol resistance protein n=1 Tax=Cyclobacterium lianum TaxID=388280 RepID=A0A1M7L7X5_9BACT|nr:multidrug effflux MFS transporter [Cyclobacterium lianum]SHM74028.1 MFS transporter, DHA1 family, bicyclomycin/chloramphenicol resistance protein [Cyclobacterium lianum]
MKEQKNYFLLVLILGALSTISPFSVDMYLPAFPAIATDLRTSISNIQLSLTSYLTGIAIGQLFYGPLLDKFGRKKPLYAGLWIYVVASIGCAFVSTYETLIIMRFVQAIGGCVGMVAAQALVRDLFPVTKIAQTLAMLTLVIAVSPMVAPTIGGYVAAHFHWHWLFILLALICSGIIVSCKWHLPDGAAPDRQISLRPVQVYKKYIEVLKNRQFLTYILVGGIAGAAPFAYIAGSSDVFINIYGLTATQYGWLFAFLSIAMIGATQLNHILLNHFSNRTIVITALGYQLVIGLIIILGVWTEAFNVWVLIGILFIFLTGHGLSVPNAAALSLAPFSKNAGSASAMMGFMRMAIGGLVTALVSVFHNGTAMPMVILMAACILIAGSVLLIHFYITGELRRWIEGLGLQLSAGRGK